MREQLAFEMQTDIICDVNSNSEIMKRGQSLPPLAGVLQSAKRQETLEEAKNWVKNLPPAPQKMDASEGA